MGQSLVEAAVRGIAKPSTELSTEAQSLLDAGDVDGLIRFHRQTFGGFNMKLEDDDHDDDDADDDADDDEDDDEDDEDDKDDKQSKSAAQKRIEELSAEAKAHRKKASERGRRIRELEARLAELEKGKQGKGKDGDEDDESEDTTQLKSDFDKVLTDNEQLRIENAFLRNNKFRWKNPKAALKLADLTDVEINDDGEVEGLDDALEALAKSDPYLLAESKGDDDEDDDDTPPKRKRTGQPPSKSKKGNPNRDKLISKYPALRR